MAWGPPKARSVPFFCLFGLNNFSKIFQKRRIFKLLLGGTHVGYPLKNSQKIYDKFTCLKIPQIITLTSICGQTYSESQHIYSFKVTFLGSGWKVKKIRNSEYLDLHQFKKKVNSLGLVFCTPTNLPLDKLVV